MLIDSDHDHGAPQVNVSNRLAGLFLGSRKHQSTSQIRKAKTLLIWAVFAYLALPLLVEAQLHGSLDHHFTAWMIGGSIFFAATLLLVRITGNLTHGGILLGSWILLVLGTEPVLLGNTDVATLSLLSLSPVVFGLVSGSKYSALSAIASVAILAATLIVALLQGVEIDVSGLSYLFLCAFSTLFAGAVMYQFIGFREEEAKSLETSNTQIRRMALTDSLTRTRNRRAFQGKLDQFRQSRTDRLKPALLLMDLDGFKQINDTYGHETGDELLLTFATRVKGLLSGGQTLYRLGGDEFAIAFDHEENPAIVQDLAERIVEICDEAMLTSNGVVKVGVSIGLAMSDGSAQSVASLYRHADNAAFSAKNIAGSSFKFFNSALEGEIQRRFDIESGLRQAIALGKIDIEFQPQLDLATSSLKGFEALARWQDPNLGKVSPVEFIQVAEQSALIEGLDRLILQKTLRQASEWLGDETRISINVSARSLCSVNFADFALTHIQRSGLRAEQVEIEITETALIENWEASKKTVNKLREGGVRIVLDDFGVGYSSLSYLAQFPVQKIKFDRSFLLQSTSPANLMVMQSIIQLAQTMDLDLVAEGVEAAAHVSVLRRLRCTEGQGFFLSRPLKSLDVPTYLDALVDGGLKKRDDAA